MSPIDTKTGGQELSG